MFDEVIPSVGKLVDDLANTEAGQKLVDNLASIVGRMHRKLVLEGLDSDQAVMILSGAWKRQRNGKGTGR